jgi:hypothetical protein
MLKSISQNYLKSKWLLRSITVEESAQSAKETVVLTANAVSVLYVKAEGSLCTSLNEQISLSTWRRDADHVKASAVTHKVSLQSTPFSITKYILYVILLFYSGKCKNCHGDGTIMEELELDLVIPPWAFNGYSSFLPDVGHCTKDGRRGGMCSINGKLPSYLVAIIYVSS